MLRDLATPITAGADCPKSTAIGFDFKPDDKITPNGVETFPTLSGTVRVNVVCCTKAGKRAAAVAGTGEKQMDRMMRIESSHPTIRSRRTSKTTE